ncbi:hypothetical protein [Myxococcus sp. AM010]|uniref:hypothetical protein n=1 Tax=Myxococcus sp. AM010 TaxID=2745138 RepID=UPI0020D08188|nr:hypothetical protein [Myxococcus sp. AM010]
MSSTTSPSSSTSPSSRRSISSAGSGSIANGGGATARGVSVGVSRGGEAGRALPPTGVSVGGTGTSGVTTRIPPSSPKSIIATGGAGGGRWSDGCELPDTAGAHRTEPESSGSVSGSSPLRYCPGASPPNIPSASDSARTGAGGGGVMLSAAGAKETSTGSAAVPVRFGRFVELIWMNRISRLMP